METETNIEVENNEGSPIYALDKFDGPLDLLYDLIQKRQINIYDIPIASITEQFLEWIKMAENVGLDDLTEFYSMAATLLLIKSKMLLPVEVDISDELEDPRKDLVDKLIEYQKYKKLSELMEQKELEAEWTIERRKMQRTLPFPDDGQMWDKINSWDLLQTFSSVIKENNLEHVMNMYEEVTTDEKKALINELLEEKKAFSLLDLITRPHSLMDVVCAFLAILAYVQERVISIYQHRLFGDIQIRPYEGNQTTDGTQS